MKMTFKLSDIHEVTLTRKQDGTVHAESAVKVGDYGLWSFCYKDFGSIEEAITHYQIKF